MNESALHLGSAFDILPEITDGSIDAVISDPPYGTTNLSWDHAIDLERFWLETNRVCRPEAVVVLFGCQPFTTALINSNRSQFRYELIWVKSRPVGFLSANRRPLRSHENILVFCRKPNSSTYNPQKVPGKPYRVTRPNASRGGKHYNTPALPVTINESGDRHPWSVLHHKHPAGRECLHPTQKPLDLMRFLVRSYSNPGDLVLDPFMGSGSTGHAALEQGRRFVGMESDQGYYDAAAARLANVENLRSTTIG